VREIVRLEVIHLIFFLFRTRHLVRVRPGASEDSLACARDLLRADYTSYEYIDSFLDIDNSQIPGKRHIVFAEAEQKLGEYYPVPSGTYTRHRFPARLDQICSASRLPIVHPYFVRRT
jgi:hypothetical protein